jgi:hypothetical protein
MAGECGNDANFLIFSSKASIEIHAEWSTTRDLARKDRCWLQLRGSFLPHFNHAIPEHCVSKFLPTIPGDQQLLRNERFKHEHPPMHNASVEIC